MKPWIVFIALFPFAGTVQAQINKCVDAAGKTVYSQSPCPRDARSTTLRSTAPASPAPAARADGKGGPKTAAEMETTGLVLTMYRAHYGEKPLLLAIKNLLTNSLHLQNRGSYNLLTFLQFNQLLFNLLQHRK